MFLPLKYMWLVIALLLLGSNALAQSVVGAIEGRVLTTNGKGLEYANILVEGPTLLGHRGETSDENGHFRVEDLPVGVYSLTISFVGYQTVKIQNIQVYSTPLF